MPIKASAQKALRQTHRRTEFNRAVKTAINKLEVKFKKEVASKKKSEAVTSLSRLTKLLDKAAKRNILSPNATARYKSNFQKAVNKIS